MHNCIVVIVVIAWYFQIAIFNIYNRCLNFFCFRLEFSLYGKRSRIYQSKNFIFESLKLLNISDKFSKNWETLKLT